MMYFKRMGIAALLLAVVLGTETWAQDKGQEDLDRATEARLGAKSMDDLGKIIELCESALKKGLDDENREFGERLLASTLVQRGSFRAQLAAHTSPSDPEFAPRRQAALEDLEKAAKLDPQQAQALLAIAQLHSTPDGDKKRMVEALDQVIALELDDPRMKARALVFRATTTGEPDQRLADLDEALRLVPGEVAALRARGLLRAASGKLEEALEDLDQAISLAPKVYPAYSVKAMVLARLKRFDEALVCLDQLRELTPDSVDPLMQKARIHAAQENLDAAVIDLDLALSMTPDNADVLLLRATAHNQQDHKEKALADVDEALKHRPEMTAAMELRAIILAKSERLDEAIAQLEAVRKLKPKDRITLLQLGSLYGAAKKLDLAVEVYSALLTEKPDDLTVLRSRGDVLLNFGKQAEAIADYEKVLAVKPKNAGVLNNMAWVLATSPDEKLRDGNRAIQLATESCRLTQYAQAHILSTLGAAYAETGNFEEAVKWAEKGLEIADEDREKEALGKELQSYRDKKPWRELMKDGEPVEMP